MKKHLVLPTFLIILLGTPAFADFQAGRDAYESGDYATALKEWTPLAEQGDAPAQNLMGAMYNEGDGVAQDYRGAVKWYKLAAKQGFALAQSDLGLMYLHGQGVTQDYKAGFKWIKLSAEQGYPAAQSVLRCDVCS